MQSFQKYIRLFAIKCGFLSEHDKIKVNIRENQRPEGSEMRRTLKVKYFSSEEDIRVP